MPLLGVGGYFWGYIFAFSGINLGFFFLSSTDGHIHTGGERIESGYRYRSDRFAGIVEVLKMLLLYGKYVYIYMNVLVVMVSLKPMIALPVQ